MLDALKSNKASGTTPSTIGKGEASKKNSAQVGFQRVTKLSLQDQSQQSPPRTHSQTPSYEIGLQYAASPEIQGRAQLRKPHDTEHTSLTNNHKERHEGADSQKGSENEDTLFVGSPVDPFTLPVRNDPTGVYAKVYNDQNKAGHRQDENNILESTEKNGDFQANQVGRRHPLPVRPERQPYTNQASSSSEAFEPSSQRQSSRLYSGFEDSARGISRRPGSADHHSLAEGPYELDDMDVDMDMNMDDRFSSVVPAPRQRLSFGSQSGPSQRDESYASDTFWRGRQYEDAGSNQRIGSLKKPQAHRRGPIRSAADIPMFEAEDDEPISIRNPVVRGRYIPGMMDRKQGNRSDTFGGGRWSNTALAPLRIDNRVSKRVITRPRSLDDGSEEHALEEGRPRNYHTFGHGLAPSRFSGTPMPWGLNKSADLHQEEGSDEEPMTAASLMKRDIVGTDGKKTTKRAYGANDPENLAIVNMRDSQGMSFEKIARELNARRTEAGKVPSLTISGVNGRYNRTAPLICAAEGREFVSASARRRGINHGGKTGIARGEEVWTEDLDRELVKLAKEYDARKWIEVSRLLEEKIGYEFEPAQCATRYSLL